MESILARLLSPAELAGPLAFKNKYALFRSTFVLVMTLISIIPLCLTVGLSHYEARKLLEGEEQNHLRWNAESARKSVEFFVRELQSVVSFVANEYPYSALADQRKLTGLFARLKKQYPHLVDLGLIDPHGIQVAYSGPFQLQGRDYSNEDWLHKAMARRVYISNVFLGYRNVPHFVVAVSKGIPGSEDYYVLRASIDAATLEQFVTTVNTDASDDIFLADYNCQLQTASRYHGAAGERCTTQIRPNGQGVTLAEVRLADSPSFHALAYIQGTPWILVMVKKSYVYGKDWSSFRNELLLILLASIIVGLLVTIRTTNILVRRIRETDERRDAILAEAEHTSKLASVGRLAAGVAHEINNPLAVIDQKAGLMKDLLEMSADFPYKQKLESQIGGIQNAVTRCKTITHRLLGFARRMEVSLEQIDINELLREVLSFLEKEASYQRIRLELDLQEGLPKINSDRGQMQQVFLNIINNAMDATSQGGVISIATSLKDTTSIHVVITDNGPGMTPEVMKHIFEPFFTTKQAGKGTGLGLSITYGLVKKLGGEISVKSKVGQGASFSVDLPVGEAIKKEE